MTTRLFLAASLILAAPLWLTPRMSHAQDAPAPAAVPEPSAAQTPTDSGAPPPAASRGDGGDRPWPPRRDWDRGDRPGPSRGMDRDHGPARDWAHDEGRGDAILPFGMWWKNPEVTTRIGLTPDQQKRIMDLFIQSRVKLITLHATLQEEQLLLEPLLDATPLDSAKTLAQIDKIADTRADLEKTNARMLLNIRGVLTTDQWTKLHSRDRGPRGPHPPRDRDDKGPQPPARSN